MENNIENKKEFKVIGLKFLEPMVKKTKLKII